MPGSVTPIAVEPLLTVRQICEQLGCSDRALRRWISAGRFPEADMILSVRQLRRGKSLPLGLRWRRATIEAFINAGGQMRPRLAAVGS